MDTAEIEYNRADRVGLGFKVEPKAQALEIAVIVPTLNELRALYVDAQVAHRGVGSAILVELEALAVSAGCSELQMHASVNAEGFYRRYGYVSRERGVHKLVGGLEMPSVRMSKSLSWRLDP